MELKLGDVQTTAKSGGSTWICRTLLPHGAKPFPNRTA